MFRDSDYLSAYKTEHTLNIASLVIAEFNMNQYDNIDKIGNYRYRPNGTDAKYLVPISNYDQFDQGDYYTGADISYIEYANTRDSSGNILRFTEEQFDRELYYSLADCFLPFRPRSGINKAIMLPNRYIDNIRSYDRPRYYMPSKNDQFKYWISYRKGDKIEGQEVDQTEKGISSTLEINGLGYAITDACPFVVYKEEIPVNRIVVKAQTNTGDSNLGVIRSLITGQLIEDPLAGEDNATVPKRWDIQYLDSNNQWIDAISFDQNSFRRDGSSIWGTDGYVEIYYGIKIPDSYKEDFEFIDYIDESLLPNSGLRNGIAYIVNSSETDPGTLKIYDANLDDWIDFTAEYGFSLLEDNDTRNRGIVNNIVSPLKFNQNDQKIYKEFIKIKGLRLLVHSMNKPESVFELIELSPRLTVNLSEYTESFSITKLIADSGTGLPVGSLSASNGTIVFHNANNAFSQNNFIDENDEGSLISKYLFPNVKIDLYEIAVNIDGYDKYIPIKSFYVENFPNPTGGNNSLSVTLRDAYFRLETVNAPNILLQQATLTMCVSNILDNIGFSNYVFKKIDNTNDPIVPYFFVEPNVSVAEILNRLAVSTQTAMFFDEYNNFVIMPKEYLLPNEGDRNIDLTLYGQITDGNLPNIESIDSDETVVINSGTIDYTIRYIQRETQTLEEQFLLNQERVFKYKPVLLWEVAGTEFTRSINAPAETGSYALGAVALNVDLDNNDPEVINGELFNNIIDVGESIYWLPRYQGYLYSNGEIIRYDAVEYSVSGQASLVWITSNQEYQSYFANLPFNGKIYPTGRIRIYTEPFYEEVGGVTILKNGAVRISGRAQFNTTITSHSAGLPTYWSDDNNVRSMLVDGNVLFNDQEPGDLEPDNGLISKYNDLAKSSSRNGIIKNFMSSIVYGDGEIMKKTTVGKNSPGLIQSSALVFNGPPPSASGYANKNIMTFVPKDLGYGYKHFGTRMRVIGKTDQTFGQNAVGAFDYFQTQNSETLSGGSGGLGIMINPETGSGYYLELVAVSADDISEYYEFDPEKNRPTITNIIFYKIPEETNSDLKYPEKLWGSLGNIFVDSGTFVGQDRVGIEDRPTVYDIAVEYVKIAENRTFANGEYTSYENSVELESSSYVFYIYVNNVLVAQVADEFGLVNNTNIVAPFVRGTSRVMFENLYALTSLTAEDNNQIIATVPGAFDENDVSRNEGLIKYALSGIIQDTYLSGNKFTSPDQKIYFEEFGTIMRECAYFNIQYDQAYPAFLAKIAPTFGTERGFTVSGFYGGPYEAEFLVFNATDKALVLDENSGNYLRILGVTFTQDTTQQLTVDDYFQKVSNFSDPVYSFNGLESPNKALQQYNQIKTSRAKYGSREFSLESMYIQSDDYAENLMGWLINKTMRPRRVLSVKTYAMPHLQIGDLVSLDYTLPESDEKEIKFVETDKRFVVTEISYNRNQNGPENTVKLVEV
jgi:hypothetical protein